MANTYYRSDDQRAAQVNRLFARIARRYDLLNDVMTLGWHRVWKRRLVQLSGVGRGSRSEAAADLPQVLDLCCGTGDIARRFRGRVIGVDFTAEMLHIAAAHQPAGCWVQADALQLPFPDQSFDVVSIGYGLRNLADLAAGLREVHRVLRPGGKLLALDLGKPVAAWWRKLFFAHLRFHLPWLGWWSCGDPAAYAYILTSLENYPAQRGVRQLMETVGYQDCGFEEFAGGAMAINFGRKPR